MYRATYFCTIVFNQPFLKFNGLLRWWGNKTHKKNVKNKFRVVSVIKQVQVYGKRHVAE